MNCGIMNGIPSVRLGRGKLLPFRRQRLPAVFVSFALLCFFVRSNCGLAAPFSDLNWVSMGGLRGFDGGITAVVVNTNTGTVYVGGDFQVGGGIIFNYVAKWDNGQWSALGSGLSGSVIVKTLALDSVGNLYVGGYFVTAGGVPANGLAKWDGNQWSGLGNNLAYGGAGVYVNSIAFDGAGNLYAGGDFTTAGPIPVNHVAKWNGNSWAALGTGLAGASTTVNCLTFDHGGNLIAAGRFNNAGGITASNVAKWNGTNWSALGSGIGGSSFARVVACTIDSDGHLYVGGDFTLAGGLPAQSLAKWNGSSWSPQEFAVGPSTCLAAPVVYSLTSDSAKNVFVSGTFGSVGGVWVTNVARWDGTNWSTLGAGVGGSWCFPRVQSLVFDGGGNLLAAWANGFERWNGSSWSAFPLPQPEPPGPGVSGEVFALTADRDSNLYVAGAFTGAGEITVANIAKWNGANWSSLSTGVNGSIYTLVFDSKGNLYSGGSFSLAGGVAATNVAKWDGNVWSAVGSGTNAVRGTVRSLIFDSAGNLYAGGAFTAGENSLATNISKWNGNAWLPVGMGISGQVNAMAMDKFGNLYAGGSFSSAGGVGATNIAKWNGTAWSPLGSGIVRSYFANKPVSALAVDAEGNLYVGGSFTNAGGIATRNVAKWNGSEWSALGSGIGDSLGFSGINALFLDVTDTLYAGGYNVLKWESGAWTLLGSGISGRPGTFVQVNALTIGGIGRLYAGGIFSIAGTNVSYRIAQANILFELLKPTNNLGRR